MKKRNKEARINKASMNLDSVIRRIENLRMMKFKSTLLDVIIIVKVLNGLNNVV